VPRRAGIGGSRGPVVVGAVEAQSSRDDVAGDGVDRAVVAVGPIIGNPNTARVPAATAGPLNADQRADAGSGRSGSRTGRC
jgi:hypothetical protein